jgi:DUF971 family protein
MIPNPSARPKAIRAPHGGRDLEIVWDDGRSCRLPHDVLRGFCPCATCQGHSGGVRFVQGQNLELREIERVGNYALALTWGDGHNSGIYTYAHLRNLCEQLGARGADGLRKLDELPR